MDKNLAKNYDPKQFEDKIYKKWEESGAFHAEPDDRKASFSIVMPPPNITGRLHMGHALDQTLQDVLTRFKRLQGYETLWLPGTDHASIATEVKVAEDLYESEGKTKEDIGREEFLKRAWEWKRLYGGEITEQMKRLGDSCDWSRERFTMDEGCNKAVTEFFIRLYEKGYIYKGHRLINWCPVCGTSISDIEVEHDDKSGKYWYFRYPFVDREGGITVATSRPETMFADVAIAVHPEDERYKDVIGSHVYIPTLDRKIPVIADEYPDPDKGTGAVKITPAHDPNDYEVGKRHKLDEPMCIDFDAKMTEYAGKYQGMDRFECRKAWVKELDEAGLLVKVEDVTIPTGTCYRCDTTIEPMLSDQWFVKMKKLAKPAMEVAKEKKLVHVPERFEKIYLHWLENINDWCISRQLWWGHRIPAYYCDDCGALVIADEMPHECERCESHNFHQDEDVLDTWFSSALWPFSTLGWPEKTPELDYFYPTSVLVTGYDIIFFWVVRMVFSAMEIMEETPFKYVYVHGLVRDQEGRKMSKSLGNGVNPLEVIDNFGADALRFMLLIGNTPGNDMRFQEERLESSRNFANKLWNASRFVIMNLKEGQDLQAPADEALRDEDKWILAKINRAVKAITANMEKFELSLAAQKIYELVWNEYCDWYIELVKARLYGEDDEDARTATYVLVKSLKDILRLLHPFMPFITEEIWTYISDKDSLLISDSWPEFKKDLDEKSIDIIETVMDVIKSVRNIRAEANAAPSKKLPLIIHTEDSGKRKEIEAGEKHIISLANISEISYISDKSGLDEVATAVIDGAEVFVPLDDLLDYEAENERLKKDRDNLNKEIKRLEGKLQNEGFIKKAPEKIVATEREKLEKYREMLEKVQDRLESLQNKI